MGPSTAGRRAALVELVIQAAICEAVDVNWQMVTGPGRRKEQVVARQLYCYFTRRFFPDRLLTDTAERLKRKSYASIVQYRAAVHDLLTTKDGYLLRYLEKVDETLSHEIKAICQSVQGTVCHDQLDHGALATRKPGRPATKAAPLAHSGKNVP